MTCKKLTYHLCNLINKYKQLDSPEYLTKEQSACPLKTFQ